MGRLFPLMRKMKVKGNDCIEKIVKYGALDYINDIRKKMGLKPVTLNPYLIKVAQNHAKYIAINDSYMCEGHYETKGKKGYTGEDPNPLKQFNVSKSGFIISYSPSFNYIVDSVNYKVTGSKGTVIKGVKEDWGSASFFYPKSALKYCGKYTVTESFVDEDSGKKISETWSFTTMKDPNPTNKPITPTRTSKTTAKVSAEKATKPKAASKSKSKSSSAKKK